MALNSDNYIKLSYHIQTPNQDQTMNSTIFSSNASQQRWVDQLNHHFIVFVENPPSIFQVPKIIVDTNPDAYAPQEIGIGAFHHFRRDLDDMESRKLGAIREFLKPEQFQDFESIVVERVKKLEPLIRSCYDKYLDLDGDALAWAMAIDGAFLLHFFTKVSPDGGKLARDVLLVENQLPFIVLGEIREALFQPPGENTYVSNVGEFNESEDGEELLSEMLYFCRLHSPIDVAFGLDAPPNNPHLLDVMYRLVAFKLSHEQPVQPEMFSAQLRFKELVGVAADLTGLKPLKFVANLPMEEFFELFGNGSISTESSVEEIQIPSVSQLHRVSRIQFEKSTSGRAVRYDEKARTLYLPVIRLNTDSEAILRNLVAYESALGSNGSNDNVVSSYVDLMCGLIDTAKDVDLLKEKEIVDTDLPSGEVAKMFNGMNKSSKMVDAVQNATEKLNEAYDSTFRIRCFGFVKNHLIPSENSVKLVLGVLLVFLLSLQAFCQVYGCSAHWFGNIASFASI